MGLFDEVVGIIYQWVPQRKYTSEQRYRDELMDFIYNQLNTPARGIFGRRNILVRKEDSRSLCDIAVERSVGVELKLGKNGKIRKAEIDRLYGQVGGYRNEYREGVIIVLVGDVDKFSEAEVRRKLEDIYNMINRGYFGFQPFRIKLINKSSNKTMVKNTARRGKVHNLYTP